MFGFTRIRLVEIGVALLLTLAAVLFIGLKGWAAEPEPNEDGAKEHKPSSSNAGIRR
jgi:hypothetical protein